MITIDGSMGEGGGQILRYAVALSAITGEPVKIVNIRAKRSNPGLRPQHMTAVKTVGLLVDADIEGLKKGSMTIVFRPRRKVKGGFFKANIGTAGSISLVLQALLPVAAFADKATTIRLTGGTSVRNAPPIPYMQAVLVPLLKRMGLDIGIKILKRGFYPRGGGIVEVSIAPVDTLSPIVLPEWSRLKRFKGLSYSSNLPSHVVLRQKKAAENIIVSRGYGEIPRDIRIDWRTPAIDKGSGIVIWAVTDTGVVGGDALGEKGKPAERVGSEAAEKLLSELETRAAVDQHALDNLLIYAALASGESMITASHMTLHAETVIELCKIIVGARFHVEKLGNRVCVRCLGKS